MRLREGKDIPCVWIVRTKVDRAGGKAIGTGGDRRVPAERDREAVGRNGHAVTESKSNGGKVSL
jgi:hypothetical protein